jgi:GH15 family glucan-1,4-alpha-glucosidase
MKLLIKKLLREGLLPEEFNSSNTRYYHGNIHLCFLF